MSFLVNAHPLPTALSAGSCPTFRDVCVQKVEGMPVHAKSLASMLSTRAVATLNICLQGHWLKMFWAHAIMYTAQMVKSESYWNLAHKPFIRKAMGINQSNTIKESAISLRIYSTSPQPAIGSLDNFRPEAFLSGQRPSWHNKTPWRLIEAHGASREPLSRTRGHGSIIA